MGDPTTANHYRGGVASIDHRSARAVPWVGAPPAEAHAESGLRINRPLCALVVDAPPPRRSVPTRSLAEVPVAHIVQGRPAPLDGSGRLRRGRIVSRGVAAREPRLGNQDSLRQDRPIEPDGAKLSLQYSAAVVFPSSTLSPSDGDSAWAFPRARTWHYCEAYTAVPLDRL